MICGQAELERQYKRLYAELQEILFRIDPVGINFGDNADEYDPEIGTIISRLKFASSESDVLNIIHEEFIHWFGEEGANGVSRAIYRRIAAEVWSAWNNFPCPAA